MLATRRYAFLLALGLTVAWCAADTLWIGARGRKPQVYENVRITKIDGDTIFFEFQGRLTEKELRSVARMQIESEGALSAADEAAEAQRWDEAAELYQKAINGTDKDWVKKYCAPRLAKAAASSGRFDIAVTSWASAVLNSADPDSVTKPPLPEPSSRLLQPAATSISEAIASKQPTAAQKRTLLFYLLDIHRVSGNVAERNRVLAELEKVSPGATGTDTSTSPNTPSAVDIKLANIHIAMDEKKYDKVISEIEANKSMFTTQLQQADALYCIAEAKSGLLKGDDPAALKDVALAYMRVVAHFKAMSDAPPMVADSLLKTAMIVERLKEQEVANRLYKQVVDEFPRSPAAAKAREKLQPILAPSGT